LAFRRAFETIGGVRRNAYYTERARELRAGMTAAEKRMWSRLRAHRFEGLKFRRQHAIGNYIVDFVCLKSRLVIEVDGETHGYEREAPDAARTAWLQRQGFRVLRFWNNDVLIDTDAVMESIYYAVSGEALVTHSPLPNPLP
jgi:very-short-patch-repair endonuclease